MRVVIWYLSRCLVSGVRYMMRAKNIYIVMARGLVSVADSSGFAVVRLVNALGCHQKMQCI